MERTDVHAVALIDGLREKYDEHSLTIHYSADTSNFIIMKDDVIVSNTCTTLDELAAFIDGVNYAE